MKCEDSRREIMARRPEIGAVSPFAVQCRAALEVGEPFLFTDLELVATFEQCKNYGQSGAGEIPRCR